MSISPIGTRVPTLSPNSIIRAGVPLVDDFNATDVAVTVESLLSMIPPGGIGTLQQVSDTGGFTNGSTLQQGTYDFGGNYGISRICSVNYEDNWQSGIHHIFDNNGLIRESNNCFSIIPDSSFDDTLRFKIGSRWVLDNGTTYVCIDPTATAAIWVVQSGDYTPNLTLSSNITSYYFQSGTYSVSGNVMTLGIYIQQITIDFNANTDALISIELPTGFQSGGEAAGSVSVKYNSAPIGAATPIFTNGRYAGGGKIGIYLQNYGGVANDVYDITATFVMTLQ